MEKKIEHYAPFYIGCKVRAFWGDKPSTVTLMGVSDGILIYEFDRDENEISYSFDSRHSSEHPDKLLLRPLSSIREEERKGIFKMVFGREFPENGGTRFIEKTKKDPSRWVMSSGLYRLGIEYDGTIWYDDDLHVYRFNQHEMTRYLLSKGFDLFGLIEAGLAIDSTKQL